MNRHRIFIAINLPENIKNKLGFYQKEIEEMFASSQDYFDLRPANWTREGNFHITLNFLGNVFDQDIIDICAIMEEVASNHSGITINLKKICYGPDNKIPPKMIWAIGEKTKQLNSLKADLDKKLEVADGRGFTPHITLAKIRKTAWQRIEPEQRPQIGREINLAFEVNSIELMESFLKRKGSEYAVLESFNFGK